MRRIVVVGCSGSGKSTLAQSLADRLGLEHIELDSLWHLQGWEHCPVEEFRSLLRSRLDGADDGWVVCGNYQDATGGLHTDPNRRNTADTVVWLDLERSVVMPRLITRTLRRLITRERLWDGPRERWSNLYAWDIDRNIIRWSWVTHQQYRDEYETKMRDGSWAHMGVQRLRTRGDVEKFLS